MMKLASVYISEKQKWGVKVVVGDCLERHADEVLALESQQQLRAALHRHAVLPAKIER